MLARISTSKDSPSALAYDNSIKVIHDFTQVYLCLSETTPCGGFKKLCQIYLPVSFPLFHRPSWLQHLLYVLLLQSCISLSLYESFECTNFGNFSTLRSFVQLRLERTKQLSLGRLEIKKFFHFKPTGGPSLLSSFINGNFFISGLDFLSNFR